MLRGIMRYGIGAAFFVFGLLFVYAATAAPVAETIEQFGFSGTWASDCDKPPAPDNIRRTVSTSARGDVEFVERFGDTYDPNVYEMSAARLSGKNTLILTVQLGDTQQELTIRKSGDRLRTMRNRASDGTIRVKDGIVVATGKSTLWLTRCGGKP